MAVAHKQCDIEYIPEVSETYLKNATDYLYIEENLNTLKERCVTGLCLVHGNIAHVEAAYAAAMSSIDNIRQEIIVDLDKIVKESKKQVDEYRERNLHEMQSLKTSYQSIVKNIREIETKRKLLKNENKFNLIYCEVKKAQQMIPEYQSQVYHLFSKLNVQECKIEQSLDIEKLKMAFGTVNIQQKPNASCNVIERVQKDRVCQLNIKGNRDKKTCVVTGLDFMTSDHLAAADKANKNVKIVDTSINKLISEITLSSSPRDITVVVPDKLAVTLRDEKIIQFLSTSSSLTKDRQIKTDGNCRGIKYDRGNLIVTFDKDPRLIVMSLEGQKLETITNSLLVNPHSIGLTPDFNEIYVSDQSQLSLCRISRHGSAITLEQKKFISVAVSGLGSVFATSNRDEMYLFDDTLSDGRVVIDQSDGLRNPIALTICRETNLLVVSCGSGGAEFCDKLHVYQIVQSKV